MMTVQVYLKEDGTSPFDKWFKSLNSQAAKRVKDARSRLESGNTSNIKWFKGIGEYRIHWGSGYRIYLAQEGKQSIIIFGGGTKKSQQSDIKKAKELKKEKKQSCR